jgi:ribonuclease inhibitor
MGSIIINGESIKNVNDFHQQIKRLLNFPGYYGENLDALWDCLSELETPITIIWKDHTISAANLNSYFDRIAHIFKDAEKEFKGFLVEYK